MIAADEFDEMKRRLREASHEALAAAPLLERWFVDRSLGKPCLVGFVSGHPEIVDGRCVRTSLLLRIAPEAGWARTRNRFYRLGRSLDEWRVLQ
ncbi:DUF6634 family protein [Chenggangzhangella methanolivorans]|uniref:Uncharacterized protein n=1 Tax=Chenggangzhangella methanolivorans TaxID=1437009 RepID=A0A9E6UMH0_9HYPH|nr:DUF6634 family protein [Chenggangzhangella methanolivorans]QZO01667.1 hypothetical protein K6K41_09855 [Chenggangzhangella methanolivorans]